MTLLRLCRHCPRAIPETERFFPECARTENARRARKAKRNGLKTAYGRDVRRARLSLDSGLCTFKLRGCTTYAETVHLAPELRGDHRLATPRTRGAPAGIVTV